MKAKRLFLICAAGLLCLGAHAEEPERPRLVVGIVVDQMRWDYLYRYYDRYGEGGFKRLLREGFSCENTLVDYIPTVTAIGHTCIYTGSVPSIHGIAGNDFFIERTGTPLYCTDDPSVHGIGSDSDAGKMSPRNLLVTTVTDELRLATNFRSKTIGVALKDRASILPAGHAATAAYWFDDQTGRWISSSYYMDALPAWVEAFNKEDRAAAYLAGDWNTLYPLSTYVQSTADDTRYEKPFTDGAPVFPVPTSRLFKEKGYKIIRDTPYGNTLTLDMAAATLTNERMGQGEETDFLAVSLSSTDYVGHRFGVNAVETEDTYLRLDRDLATFLQRLDEAVGKGNYLLFLTADHAAAHNARFLADNRLPSGNWLYKNTESSLDSLVEARFGISDAVLSMENYQVHLNLEKINRAGKSLQAIKDVIVSRLEEENGIAYVVDMQKAAVSPVPALIRERIINGYNRERSGEIQIIVKPGWYDLGSQPDRGTTHGVWSPYDSHIPLLFMGWHVRPGRTNHTVHMTDIAPTVAALLRIQMPSGCVGNPIEAVATPLSAQPSR